MSVIEVNETVLRTLGWKQWEGSWTSLKERENLLSEPWNVSWGGIQGEEFTRLQDLSVPTILKNHQDTFNICYGPDFSFSALPPFLSLPAASSVGRNLCPWQLLVVPTNVKYAFDSFSSITENELKGLTVLEQEKYPSLDQD